MKDNYLKRFEIVIENQTNAKEELINHNNQVKEETLKQFGELKTSIAELHGLVKGQTEFCKYIQQRKPVDSL